MTHSVVTRIPANGKKVEFVSSSSGGLIYPILVFVYLERVYTCIKIFSSRAVASLAGVSEVNYKKSLVGRK